VGDNVLLGVRHLDGLGRAEQLAEQTGHVADRLLGRGAEDANAGVGHAHDDDHEDQWCDDGQREARINVEQAAGEEPAQ